MRQFIPAPARAALVIAALLALALGGCASRTAAPDRPMELMPAYVNAPYAKVEAAARSAFDTLGLLVKNEQPGRFLLYNPRQGDFVSGRGGETVYVWLEADGPGATKVYVQTDKDALYLTGQSDWRDDILREITKGVEQE